MCSYSVENPFTQESPDGLQENRCYDPQILAHCFLIKRIRMPLMLDLPSN